jgi:hypothetical protein
MRALIASFSVVALLVVMVGSGLGSQKAGAVPVPAPTTFANDAAKCNPGFFGLKPWYAYMPDSEIGVRKIGDTPADPCGIKCFNIFVQADPNACGETASDIPGVILAVIDDLLRIAGLVAVGFIIAGSFQYVGSRGNAERTASAQSTIVAALTGLGIALVSVALVSYLGNQLGG